MTRGFSAIVGGPRDPGGLVEEEFLPALDDLRVVNDLIDVKLKRYVWM